VSEKTQMQAAVNGYDAISALTEALDLTDASVVDPPAEETGTWWVDIQTDTGVQTVNWHPERGYGLFRRDQTAFGERPADLTHDVEVAAQWVRDN
jgi:hypothetical protein